MSKTIWKFGKVGWWAINKNGTKKFFKGKDAKARASKFRAQGRSGGSKSTKKKSPSKKKKSSTKKKSGSSKSKGSKKMGKRTSRLSPVNKNGLKLVTAGLLLGGGLIVFGVPEGQSISPWQEFKNSGDLNRAFNRGIANVSGGSAAAKVIKGTIVVGAAASVLNVNNFGFVQFK